ncbi:MAG: hypothetical protein ACRCVT_15130 [Leadbetterella sp.]
MNRYILLLSVLFISYSKSQAQAKEEELKNTISDFFKAMYAGDSSLIKTTLYKEFNLQSILVVPTKSPKVSKMLQPSFLKAVASKKATDIYDERLLDYKFMIEEHMAVVWTPYEFYYNGKKSHTGTNVFTFAPDENNQWKILSIVDTRRF